MRRRFGSAAAPDAGAGGVGDRRRATFACLARDDLGMKGLPGGSVLPARPSRPTSRSTTNVRAQQKNARSRWPDASLEEARDLARQQLADQRRQASIADWIGDLRRRADITELYPSRR